MKYFCDFSRCLKSTTNIGKFNFTKISWLIDYWKMAQNIDQCINDFSHKIIKEMQFLMGERYPLGVNFLGIEDLSHFFENRCLIALEGGETPMAYCSI